MINEELYKRAENLAGKNYDIDLLEPDTLSDGRIVYLAESPELPGCMAQGFTQSEAIAELRMARAAYIYALLEENLPIPETNEQVLYIRGLRMNA